VRGINGKDTELDNIQNALLEKGVDWSQARSRAQDRKIWHALC
jgi:hypothetical protein